MSFDEYVNHISQKYRLAVAISVIKTKPNNLSIEEYLLQLQSKIRDMEFDPNETLCSDDFNFDDDDVSYEKYQHNTYTEKSKNDCSANETLLGYSVNLNDSQCSQTILNDFVFDDVRLAPDLGRESTIGDTIRLLKEVTAVQEKSDSNNLSQLTFCESQEGLTTNNITYCNTNNNSHTQDSNVNNDPMDSQQTELYTFHGFTQNDTHVSQTQGDYFVMLEKYIRSDAGTVGKIQDAANNVNRENRDNMLLYNASQNLYTQKDFANSDGDAIGTINISQHQVNDIDDANAQSFQFIGQDVNTICVIDNNFTDNNGVKTIDIGSHVGIGNFDTQTLQFNIQSAIVREEFSCNVDTASTRGNKDISKGVIDISVTENYIKDLNSTENANTLLSNNSKNTGLHNETAPANYDTETVNDKLKGSNIICKDNEDIAKTKLENQQLSKEINMNEQNEQEMDVDTESDDNIKEGVPFKVLEELNRVKAYLNRKDRDRRNYDGCSTDSGYRSDSQTRSSLKSASQACGAWLNQSAYCLFNYLLHTAGADDFDKEIAQTLGQLIDKLHEDENYPPFLEIMLETVDGLLVVIHEGDSAENVLITKDENIKRLLLLNKSKHILKHTLEKITNMLEKLHTNLTQENLYELTNIIEVENTSYIFHVLEKILKRYVKSKDVSSQSTQNSQDDTFPKRSSLTELWRKKWNPQCKEIIKIDNKVCVLKRCREILNKIIVECMDGYSLVAFASLQCFNLIQI